MLSIFLITFFSHTLFSFVSSLFFQVHVFHYLFRYSFSRYIFFTIYFHSSFSRYTFFTLFFTIFFPGTLFHTFFSLFFSGYTFFTLFFHTFFHYFFSGYTFFTLFFHYFFPDTLFKNGHLILRHIHMKFTLILFKSIRRFFWENQHSNNDFERKSSNMAKFLISYVSNIIFRWKFTCCWLISA